MQVFTNGFWFGSENYRIWPTAFRISKIKSNTGETFGAGSSSL
jgi:hypothetical protein